MKREYAPSCMVPPSEGEVAWGDRRQIAEQLTPSPSVLARVARTILLGQLAFMFGGGVLYLEILSIWVLYSYYGIMIGCSLVCLATDARARRNTQTMVPYALWYVLFSLWIVWVSVLTLMPDEASFDVVRCVTKAFVVWPAVAAVLTNREHLARFARWLTVAITANAVVSFLTPTHPSLFAFILRTEDVEYAARYGEVARSCGIWGNPNQAAHAFVFAALLSLWASGVWRWLACASAIIGIYLSASRQGIYLLGLIGVSYLCYLAKRYAVATQVPRVVFLLIFVAMLSGGVLIGYNFVGQGELLGTRNITRVTEIGIGDGTVDEGSRLEIALMSIEKAMNGPWYGQGAYSFRNYLIKYGAAEQDRGTHNIYLAIWGEAGLPMLAAYLLVLGWGFRRVTGASVISAELLAMALMWLCYLLIGLTWQDQMGDFNGLIFIALLFILPTVLERVYDNTLSKSTASSGSPYSYGRSPLHNLQ